MSETVDAKQIKDAVFSEYGIRLSEQDPIFAVVLANRLMLGSAGGALQEVVRDIPRAINASIENIILAVEDSEKTVGSLRDETKGMLQALAKLEVEQTHQRIKEIVAGDIVKLISDQAQSLRSTVAQAEEKVRGLSSQLRDSRIYLINLWLSIAFVFTIGFAGIGLVMMYNYAGESKSTSNYWYEKYRQQNDAMKAPPSDLKGQKQESGRSKG